MKFKLVKIVCLFVFCLAANNCCVSSDGGRLAQRLKSLERTLPLPYHECLDGVVASYASKPLPDAFVVSEPFLDSALAQRGMPQEMKYLPLALSAMKTDYANGDRCGVWSLPSLAAMRYGLAVDESHDERYAIRNATHAALNYLNDLHRQYDDWWRAILAYTNSPNALHHAIDRNGDSLQLWDFDQRQLLPDTRVVANLIACIYAYEGVDRPAVKDVSIVEPVERPKAVEPKEIAAITEDSSAGAGTQVSSETKKTNSETTKAKSTNTQKYKVKKGDTLSHIARKYHVTVKNLMRWNNLKNDRIREGQTLIIKK